MGKDLEGVPPPKTPPPRKPAGAVWLQIALFTLDSWFLAPSPVPGDRSLTLPCFCSPLSFGRIGYQFWATSLTRPPAPSPSSSLFFFVLSQYVCGPLCDSMCVSVFMFCFSEHLFVCSYAWAFARNAVFLFLHVFTFTHHLFLIIPSACFLSLGYPYPDAGNFHPFLHSSKCQEGRKKVCSVDRLQNLLVSVSSADPNCGEPQNPAPAGFCILEIPHSLQNRPLVP